MVEGCVRELYGALVARWQAEHAADADVRAILSRIAADELGHAALALRVHAWIHRRLSPAARERVDVSRRRALAGLAEEVLVAPDEGVARAMGLPSVGQASALVASIAAAG